MPPAAVARGFFNDFDADGTRDSAAARDDPVPRRGGRPPRRVRYRAPHATRCRSRASTGRGWWKSSRSCGAASATPPRSCRSTAPSARCVTRARSCTTSRTAAPCPAVRAHRAQRGHPADQQDDEWWDKPSLDRHAYFYPHVDAGSGCPAHGHARAAQEGSRRSTAACITTRTATSGAASSISSPTSSARIGTSRPSNTSIRRCETPPGTRVGVCAGGPAVAGPPRAALVGTLVTHPHVTTEDAETTESALCLNARRVEFRFIIGAVEVQDAARRQFVSLASRSAPARSGPARGARCS